MLCDVATLEKHGNVGKVPLNDCHNGKQKFVYNMTLVPVLLFEWHVTGKKYQVEHLQPCKLIHLIVCVHDLGLRYSAMKLAIDSMIVLIFI